MTRLINFLLDLLNAALPAGANFFSDWSEL